MSTLENYQHFAGRHYETGTVHNYYAYRGVNAPHTNQPYSEALLLGISGGIVFGYFSFAYAGYDPHVALLTRNTFDPLNTLLARLGVAQEVRQTAKPEKGLSNLIETVNDGVPAIVWADMWSMPYNAMPHDAGMWSMTPLLVYGYDEEANQVWIADRAKVPLTVTPDELMAARARVKKDKFRVVTLDMPDPDKLSSAVTAGIWDCINLFTEKPPKGSSKNFGFAAYQQWIDLLTKPKQRLSWAKVFPPGVNFYAGLTTAFDHMGMTGILGNGERSLYADFLDEATLILEKPALSNAAERFRNSAKAWSDLGRGLLPDEIPLLRESRELTVRKRQIFIESGNEALPEIQQINERRRAIRQSMIDEFPLSEEAVSQLQGEIAAKVQQIHEIEVKAVGYLKEAMSSSRQ